MQIVYGFFGNLYYVLRKYMREFGVILKKEDLLQWVKLWERVNWSRSA